MSSVSKAIAGAVAGAVSAGVGAGSLAAFLPDGVTAPWWAYAAFPILSAAVGFASVYFAPKNSN